MNQQDKSILIEKLFSGTISRDEKRRLELASLDDNFLFDALEGYNNSQNKTTSLDSVREKLHKRVKKEAKRRSIWIPRMGVAASLLVMASLFWWVNSNGNLDTDQYSESSSKSNGGAMAAVMEEEKVLDTSVSGEEDLSKKEGVMDNDEQVTIATDIVQEYIQRKPKITAQQVAVPKKRKVVSRSMNGNATIVSSTNSESKATSPSQETKVKNIDEQDAVLDEFLASEPVYSYREEEVNEEEPLVVQSKTEAQEFVGVKIGDVNGEIVFEDVEMEKDDEVVAESVASKMKSAKAAEAGAFGQSNIEETLSGNKIDGIVMDFSGDPIIGANVGISGSNKYTVTDIEGKFSLNVDRKVDENLEISYTGYNKKEINIIDRNDFNVKLESNQLLDEVAIFGQSEQFGFQPKDGWDAYNDYLTLHKKRTPEAIQANIFGDVTLTFSIAKNGNPVDFKVVTSLGYGLDEVAIEMVKSSGKWTSLNSKNQGIVTISF